MKLFHKQYSEQGQPLIILHGLFGNQGNWASHARKLAETYSVYAFDLRNHGRSDWNDNMSYQSLAQDVQETMVALNIKQAHFIAHSMGGKTAMTLALLHPELFDKLIVVDIAPITYPAGPYPVLQGLTAINTTQLQSRTQADDTLKEHVPEKGIRDFLLTNLQKTPEGSFKWRINLEILNATYDQIKAWPTELFTTKKNTFPGEVLFIKGGDSDYILRENKEEIINLFPNAKVKVIEGSGHWVHSEKPETFLKVASSFLNK